MIVSTGLDAVRPDQLHDADRSSGFPYARAARSGPFVIGKTMPPDPAHVSSVDQLDCVLQRLLVFNSGLPRSSTVVHACKRREFYRESRISWTPSLRFSPHWIPQVEAGPTGGITRLFRC